MTDEKNSKFTTLDYKENIIVRGNPFKAPSNEYVLLLDLREGLEFLNHVVEQYESKFATSHPMRKIIDGKRLDSRHSYMTTDIPDDIPRGLITCAFHWYSVSACQYVRTVGTIAYKQDQNRPKPDEYVDKIIHDIRVFRDKIGAHAAWSMKNNRDNEAERLASVLPQLAIEDNRFVVSVFRVRVVSSGKSSDSGKLKPWSITTVHKELRERYWPAPM